MKTTRDKIEQTVYELKVEAAYLQSLLAEYYSKDKKIKKRR